MKNVVLLSSLINDIKYKNFTDMRLNILSQKVDAKKDLKRLNILKKIQ